MSEDTAVEEADKSITEAVAPARHTPLVKSLGWLSELADQPQLISICAATAVAGMVLGNPRMARAGVRMLASELLATKMKNIIKRRVDRTRPSVVDEGGDYEMRPGDSHANAMTSFPSGHTAGAVTVAQAFAREYPSHRAAASGAALAVALIQVPRCRHYPTDLAAGALVGIAAELIVDSVGTRLSNRLWPKP